VAVGSLDVCLQCGRKQKAAVSGSRCTTCGGPLLDLMASSVDERQRAVYEALLHAAVRRLENQVVVACAGIAFALPVIVYLFFPYNLGAITVILALAGGVAGGMTGKLGMPLVTAFYPPEHPFNRVHTQEQRRRAAMVLVLSAILGASLIAWGVASPIFEFRSTRRTLTIIGDPTPVPDLGKRLLAVARRERSQLAACFDIDRDLVGHYDVDMLARIIVRDGGRAESLRPETSVRCVADVLAPEIAAVGPRAEGLEIQLQIGVRRPLLGDRPVILLPSVVTVTAAP
jgi:hypothetical protein